MNILGIPNYQGLDVGGEAPAAAERMEARAREPASQEMFERLVLPLLEARTRRVLEVGAGTGALSRRISQALAAAEICASDKSEGMLLAARRYAGDDFANVTLARWDVLREADFPFDSRPFDLVISSVMVPYLDDAQTADLVQRLSARLSPGGVLAFVEQDLQTDALCVPSYELFRRVLAKDERALKRTVALGLRPLLRDAGLEPLARRSFLWTDEAGGPYTRELLSRMADDAGRAGRLSPHERQEWSDALEGLRASGDFYYGLVYHLVAGRKRTDAARR